MLDVTAFSLGMWVDGRALAPGGREMRPLKEEDGDYGWIDNLSDVG